MGVVERGREAAASGKPAPKVDRRAGTLERGLSILELIGSAGRVSVARLVEDLALSRSAAYRVLGTLRERGYVEWDEPSERVGLGFRLIRLGVAALGAREPIATASARLRELSHQVGESAQLAVRDRDEMVYVAHENVADHSIVMRPLLGARRALHSTALGKAYLAALPGQELDALLARLPLPRHTANTITDADRLRGDLENVRMRGYAVDDVENEPGVVCFGAAVLDHSGRPACAISVAGPQERMRAQEHRMGRLVAAAARAVSLRLGRQENTT